MCIFSATRANHVHVAATRIFARCSGEDQWLAYEMSFGSAADVAMVLPLPVATAAGDDACRFVDLSGYATVFDDLAALFPDPEVNADLGFGAPQAASRQLLVVHRVGDFEASYVPSIADFDRLDPRFRLAPDVWNALPMYGDYGFAVFKLFAPPAPARRGLLGWLGLRRPATPDPTETRRVHPMAFAFRTRDPDRAFFPTVHVHDGTVQPRAAFDHELYCQRASAPAPVHGAGWDRAARPVPTWRDSKGLFDAGVPCFRRTLAGELPNADVWAE